MRKLGWSAMRTNYKVSSIKMHAQKLLITQENRRRKIRGPKIGFIRRSKAPKIWNNSKQSEKEKKANQRAENDWFTTRKNKKTHQIFSTRSGTDRQPELNLKAASFNLRQLLRPTAHAQFDKSIKLMQTKQICLMWDKILHGVQSHCGRYVSAA